MDLESKEQDLLCEPPTLERADREGDTVGLTFANVGEGLQTRGDFPQELEVLLDGEKAECRVSVENDLR